MSKCGVGSPPPPFLYRHEFVGSVNFGTRLYLQGFDVSFLIIDAIKEKLYQQCKEHLPKDIVINIIYPMISGQ
jgi:hypothetical protein